MDITIYARQVGGHVVQKSRILLTEVGQNFFRQNSQNITTYCVACALLYSTVACLAILKSSSGVCKLKQLELQFNLQDRRAHSVGSKLRG